nr:WG repeat-containing protein [uncultured Allomuricauda sp.]
MKTIITILAIFLSATLTAQLPKALDEVAPFSEGLAGIRMGNQWAFIDDLGNIIIDFRGDVYWNSNANDSSEGVKAIRYPKFTNGRCIVRKYVDEIPIYGFIDTKGELVIEYQFLNVNLFKDGVTTGIIHEKIFRGRNEFKLNIYEDKFHEVLMDTSGEIIEFLGRRYNIQLKKSRYELPRITSKILNDKLVAIRVEDNWEIRKLNF